MKIVFIVVFVLALHCSNAQELYIQTEPASNMAAHSLGLRANNYIMPMRMDGRVAYRFDPEIMWGVNKKLMLHANLFASNMFQSAFKMEGASVYAKYRFLSVDQLHRHFRMAAFGKISVSGNPYAVTMRTLHSIPNGTGGFTSHYIEKLHNTNELMPDGGHSAIQAGVVLTQLLHKLALSSSLSSIKKLDNLNGNPVPAGVSKTGLQGTLSAGYLLFPKKYTNYGQTNVNLYFELIGQRSNGNKEQFLDAAPGLQFIFNSISRLDLGYRFQVQGNMSRFSNRQFLVRYEYNWLNLRSRKKPD